MNAKKMFTAPVVLVAALACAAPAAAQSSTIGSTAPVAQQGSTNLTWAEAGGQQTATAPKVLRGAGLIDPQAPPPPPMPTSSTPTPVAGQAPKAQMPMLQMPKGQLVNVKIEFTITDQIGTKPPTKKTMTLTVADRENGRIRTTTDYPVTRTDGGFSYLSAPLSVDVMPAIDGGKVRLEFSLEYSLAGERDPALPAGAQGQKTNVSERLSAILDSGVPLVIAQSSDALTDRKLTIEVKATIVK